MKTVEEALLTRLNGDSTLKSLLGNGSDCILHAMEAVYPLAAGTVTYSNVSGGPGGVNTDDVKTVQELYQFSIFSQNYEAVKERIRRLLEDYPFPALPDGSIKSCILEYVGPDDYDADLRVGVKRIRFKVEICRSAEAPV